MGHFKRFTNDLALKEIPLLGHKFTWSNQQHSPALVRLDRVLCSVDWEEKFPNCLLQSMASNDSDHCPLLLGLRDNKDGRRRFHFEAFWPKLEGFQEAVSVAWNSVAAGPCPFITLDLKFKAVCKGLQSWSDKKVGHINSQLVLAREILHQLEIAQDLYARHRKRKIFIGKTVAGDQIYTNHADKVSIIDGFYNSLLGTSVGRDNTVDLTELGLDTHDLAELDLPFTAEEVWRTIEQLPPDKAPGPNGFMGRFYKSCWSMIKDDVMAAVSDLNLQKSNVLPIRCGDTELITIQSLLPCAVSDFPCKYLGLPLSLKKLTKAQIQPIVDKIAD
ncbi:uncharacterized protein [Miscanthus floridulus]|uniref:uncharacterized protein n=1 Tax=Miscanthus floridulus TaxID=154761 RepID=UPI0034579683